MRIVPPREGVVTWLMSVEWTRSHGQARCWAALLLAVGGAAPKPRDAAPASTAV